MSGDLVTVTDIAVRMRVDKRAVRRWAGKPDFPQSQPVIRAGRTRDGYQWAEVVAFCRRHGLPKRIISDAPD